MISGVLVKIGFDVSQLILGRFEFCQGFVAYSPVRTNPLA